MNIQIPGVDLDKAVELFEDDIDLFVTVARSYVSSIPAVLDKIRLIENQMIENQNVSAAPLADYAVSMHSIKGTCQAIAAEETRKAALNLEQMAKAGNVSGILAENQVFLKQADKLIDDIRKWLKQFDA